MPTPLLHHWWQNFYPPAHKPRHASSTWITVLHYRAASIIFLAILLTAPLPALAQGCLPSTGGGGMPPCCATTNMSAGGDCMAPAKQFSFTLFSFGLEKTDGTVVEFGSARSFDAASVGAGGDLGNYIAGARLSPGVYIAARPTISRDITAAAQTTTADGRLCSGSVAAPSRQPDGSPWPSCAAGQPDGATPACANGGQLRLRDGGMGNLAITEGGGATITIRLDVNNGVVCHFPPGTGSTGTISLGILAVRVTKS